MNKYFLIPALAIVAAMTMGNGGCTDNSGSNRETKATMQNQEAASMAVNMPGIVNYTEKRNYKLIYELRDNPKLITYSYYIDLNGKRHSICPTVSLGFPIPYATQYTAPKAARVVAPVYPDGTNGNWVTEMMDQPEPNGLYMPASADATWVICVDPATKQPSITYVEDKVMTYQFEMPHVD